MIVVVGAGVSEANGVYYRAEKGGKGLIASFCKENDCDMSNLHYEPSHWGWGIQTNTGNGLHHRYAYGSPGQGIWRGDMHVFDPAYFTRMREGGESCAGVAPIPTVCCKEYDMDFVANNNNNNTISELPPPFRADDCDEITVRGAGRNATNGIYSRSTQGLPNGGQASYGYFCKKSDSGGCKAGVFNQWGSVVTVEGLGLFGGWGIQNDLHHTYSNMMEVSDVITAFSMVRVSFIHFVSLNSRILLGSSSRSSAR